MMSLAGYVLVSQDRARRTAQEATIKYFIYAAVALAVMAYGLTFLYGLTGSLEFIAIGRGLLSADRFWILASLLLILVGYGFEITLVPFHVWAPDVFAGTTAPVAGFLSVVPKTAALAAMGRFCLTAVPPEVVDWPLLLAIFAAATMTFGNVVALAQDRVKRMLAYSSIGQAGYLVMVVAVLGRSDDAVPALAYYLLAYTLMNLAAFTVAGELERITGSDDYRVYRGLARQHPVAAVALALPLLSLAGIPPLAGFAGKVFLLEATLDGGFAWVAVLAAVNMVIALWYYVHLIALMAFHEPRHPVRPVAARGWGITAWTLVLALLLLGIAPGLPLFWLSYGRSLLR